MTIYKSEKMITRLGALGDSQAEEGSSAPIEVGGKRVTVMVLYRAKVIGLGRRNGQIVDVLSERRGEAVCVFEGNRFKLSVDNLQQVRRRTSRKRKSK